ncbi:hypothetical protein E1301_Tti021859 [Triplophysa tibetana]|uniref:Uncharacterized protein n=1 Tax=Triplophysa tibetana TaxID=1572043 RepID=A0A5A9N9T7_9TELE|nr:hypothetical protein E1301_Tti021859 [Triplophysa tibetana]
MKRQAALRYSGGGTAAGLRADRETKAVGKKRWPPAEISKPRGNGGLVAMMTLEVLLSPELLQRMNFFVKN